MKQNIFYYIVLLSIAFSSLLILAAFFGGGGHKAESEDCFSTFDQGVRDKPIELQVYPLWHKHQTPGFQEQLRNAARSVRPHFRLRKIPIVLVYHALRVWGPKSPSISVDHRLDSQREMDTSWLYRTLTDQSYFEKYCRFTINSLLVPSPYGVRVVTTVDGDWGAEWGSSHVGKYLQVMADLGVSPNAKLRMRHNRTARLVDVIRDEALRYDYSEEPEWICCGLCRYLKLSQWRNRFGEDLSFEELARRLVVKPFGEGSCEGTHVPMALATLLNVNERSQLISSSMAEAIRARLKEFSRHLSTHQNSDGSWSLNWHNRRNSLDGSKNQFIPSWNGPILTTGHHLEWMMLCPPDLRPPPYILDAAVLHLLRNLPDQRDIIESDFHAYMPASHAVRALLYAFDYQWACPDWLR